MKAIKLCNRLFISFLFSCMVLCTGCANATQNFKTNAEAIEDLNNLQKSLEPLNIMGETFELEQAGADTNHRSNTYKTNNGIPKKIIYVDEYDVKEGID